MAIYVQLTSKFNDVPRIPEALPRKSKSAIYPFIPFIRSSIQPFSHSPNVLPMLIDVNVDEPHTHQRTHKEDLEDGRHEAHNRLSEEAAFGWGCR